MSKINTQHSGFTRFPCLLYRLSTLQLLWCMSLQLKSYQWLPIITEIKFKVPALILHDLASGHLSLPAQTHLYQLFFLLPIPSSRLLPSLHLVFCLCIIMERFLLITPFKSSFCHPIHQLFTSLSVLFLITLITSTGYHITDVFIHLLFICPTLQWGRYCTHTYTVYSVSSMRSWNAAYIQLYPKFLKHCLHLGASQQITVKQPN